ncbi:unnamed protein product [Hyaloperonospora brassicae]|uniref:Uncharacterized protein n=1 Tax=Hyaloperonospora brassicae TaxID=162125 RepID=A0AAV0TDK1_HYABA|nr:unnamed protein product [Hyaloperonospora brassicae]
MVKLFGTKYTFQSEVLASLPYGTDRAQAVNLLDLWLGDLVVSGRAPHEAFRLLKLEQFGGELFNEAFLPLLNKYVILHNRFDPEATTSLSNELGLLRGVSEPKGTVAEHAEKWLNAQGETAEPEYAVRQVNWDWELHGTPFGGRVVKVWTNSIDE